MKADLGPGAAFEQPKRRLVCTGLRESFNESRGESCA
jgi:hypothetical protein